MRRPVSVSYAAEFLGISEPAVLKRIRKGQLLAVPLSDRGWMVCHEALLKQFDEPVDEDAFREMCADYIPVAEACNIVCVTDGMVGRMLASGLLDGFRLNQKTWAVSRKSCEDNIREYLAGRRGAGRPRAVAHATPAAQTATNSGTRLSRSSKATPSLKRSRRPKRG